MRVLALTLAAFVFVAGCASSDLTDDVSESVADSPTSSAVTPADDSTDASDGSTGMTTAPQGDSADPSHDSTTTTTAPDGSVSTVPETVPPSDDLRNVGEVPTGLLERIIADALSKNGADRDQIIVIRAEAALWDDGSLGCPEPGVTYTQATVNGYWVELDVGGEHFDYRATESGWFQRCTGVTISSPSG